MNGETNKVFHSQITRSQDKNNYDLYDLLKIIPAKPITLNIKKHYNCDFKPKNDKQYIPKRKNKLKVKTVRDIRNIYEKDVLCDLPCELEKQQNNLLRKIRLGSSRDGKTKSLAKNILSGNKPISRSSWQIIMNINPEGQTHSSQFVLWKGKLIRVNGSKGGRHKFLCNHDLGTKIENLLKVPNVNCSTKNRSLKKKGLLQNSLSVNFKPGPLTRKKFLDNSYQKFSVGDIELVNLPKPGLEIIPAYGCSIDSTVTSFLSTFREADGIISHKWAEFAVSVVGSITSSTAALIDKDCSVSFDLNYNWDQSRILMRRDLDIKQKVAESTEVSISNKLLVNDDTAVIKNMMYKILEAVEINLNQDNMYTGVDEHRVADGNKSSNAIHFVKDKSRRRYCELGRLDVTVIRLTENKSVTNLNSCENSYCSLGCICNSLKCDVNLKAHCGRIDCMFECKCDVSKYKAFESLDSNCTELIPGILNLDHKINLNLAKEEQKFHQTVVVSGDKSILLKSKKRNWKSSKKYAEFYSNMCLKSEKKPKPMLRIVETRLNCENIEPWCMVHNLYKCFCKGKFVDLSVNEKARRESSLTENLVHDKREDPEKERTAIAKSKCEIEKYSEPKPRNYREEIDYSGNPHYYSCARTRIYAGRKYSKAYYLKAGYKIKEMEVNDKKLRKRLYYLVNKSLARNNNNENDSKIISKSNSETPLLPKTDKVKENPLVKDKLGIHDSESETRNIVNGVGKPSGCEEMKLTNKTEIIDYCNTKPNNPDSLKLRLTKNSTKKSVIRNPNIKAWLESSYQQYKKLLDLGITKSFLSPPMKGKLALHPWNFILSRYVEKKNMILVSKEQPFRIFMVVEVNHPLFHNCINISQIVPADYSKYPDTVGDLLKNKKDTNENFCILFGLSHCWEFVGSVKKVSERAFKSIKENTFKEHVNIEQSKTDDSCIELDDDSNDISVEYPIRDISESPDFSSNIEDPLHSDDSQIITDTKLLNNFQINYCQVIDDCLIADDCQISDDCQFTDNCQIADDSRILDSQSINNYIKVNSPIPSNFQIIDDSHINENSSDDSKPKTDSSKWFIMTIENDFSEIRFYKRGFFVKYESIIEAIHVARTADKTVRLSIQNCAGPESGCPQFGLYAIPNTREYCVFVGPYEINDHLGIETVKVASANINQKQTRGIWITTNKIYNILVIDNPLSFMPNKKIDESEMVPIESEESSSINTDNFLKTCLRISPTKKESIQNKTVKKPIKPIKIRKTNGFYHLASSSGKNNLAIVKSLNCGWNSIPAGNSLIKSPISTVHCDIAEPLSRCFSKSQNQSVDLTSSGISTNNLISCDEPKARKKPIAEAAPQIKIDTVYSEALKEKPKNPNKSTRSMFILKPEEINKRVLENKILPGVDSYVSNNFVDNLDMELDIKDFLTKSTVIDGLDHETFVISDDDDEIAQHKEVWLECKNVPNFGLIKGRTNKEGLLSFQFPGFKFTEFFYEKEEAFNKINQLLSRKIYIPKNLVLKWRVIGSLKNFKTCRLLKRKDLSPNFFVKKMGIRRRVDVAQNRYSKTYTRKPKINHSVVEKKHRPKTSEENSETVKEETC